LLRYREQQEEAWKFKAKPGDISTRKLPLKSWKEPQRQKIAVDILWSFMAGCIVRRQKKFCCFFFVNVSLYDENGKSPEACSKAFSLV
jgi:hypothetical protein